jgi:hypothetical protein
VLIYVLFLKKINKMETTNVAYKEPAKHWLCGVIICPIKDTTKLQGTLVSWIKKQILFSNLYYMIIQWLHVLGKLNIKDGKLKESDFMTCPKYIYVYTHQVHNSHIVWWSGAYIILQCSTNWTKFTGQTKKFFNGPK